MSSTLKLLTKVLGNPSNFLAAKRLGISEHVFYTPEEKTVWGLVEGYFTKHANIPPHDMVLKLVPAFTFMADDGLTVSELVERMHKERVEVSLRHTIAEVEGLLQTEKYQDAISKMHKGASEASRGFGLSRDAKFSKVAEDIYFQYLDTKGGSIMRGIPYPWDPLNEATGGLLDGQFVVLYGRPKSTKTFRLLEMAQAASVLGKKRVLVATCEMAEEVMFMRIAAIACAIDYDRLKKGRLTEDEETRYREFLMSRKEVASDQEIIVSQLTDNVNARSVSALRAKVDEHEPDLILVDAVYKMLDEQTGKRDASPQTIRNICYDLQVLGQTTKIPIAVTSQANRAGEKARLGSTKDAAFGASFAMDCDLMMRIVRDERSQRTVFLIQAAREIVLDGFSVGGRCCDGMGPIMYPGTTTPDWSIPAYYLGEDEEKAPTPQANPATRFS